jgi:hypothetical protein
MVVFSRRENRTDPRSVAHRKSNAVVTPWGRCVDGAKVISVAAFQD